MGPAEGHWWCMEMWPSDQQQQHPWNSLFWWDHFDFLSHKLWPQFLSRPGWGFETWWEYSKVAGLCWFFQAWPRKKERENGESGWRRRAALKVIPKSLTHQIMLREQSLKVSDDTWGRRIEWVVKDDSQEWSPKQQSFWPGRWWFICQNNNRRNTSAREWQI